MTTETTLAPAPAPTRARRPDARQRPAKTRVEYLPLGHVVRRLRGELSAGARDAEDDGVLALANAAHAALSPEHAAHAARPPRVLVPVTLRRGDFVVDLFRTITTLGTPLDITLQELRIETFFAATAASKDALAIVTRGGVD